jgi:hypothetical protein
MNVCILMKRQKERRQPSSITKMCNVGAIFEVPFSSCVNSTMNLEYGKSNRHVKHRKDQDIEGDYLRRKHVMDRVSAVISLAA